MRTRIFVLLTMVLVLGAGIVAAQYDRECHRGRHDYQDQLFITNGTALTGTWTCAASSKLCNEDAGGAPGNATAMAACVAAGDCVVAIGPNTYYVESITNDDQFVREDVLDKPCSNATDTTDDLIAHSAVTVYYGLNAGLHATTEYVISDGAGNASAIGLSQDGMTVGGGYGSTGVTVSDAGVIQANGAITSDGAVTGASFVSGNLTLDLYNDGSFDYWEADDSTGTPADGNGTARILLGGGTLAAPGIKVGATPIYDSAGGSAFGFYNTSRFLYTGFIYYLMGLNADRSAGNAWDFKPYGGTEELTDTDGMQSWLSLQANINQSATGAYNGLQIIATETGTGDGTSGYGNNLILAGTPADLDMWRVDNTGKVWFTAREHADTIPIGSLSLGPAAPTKAVWGTFIGLLFDDDADTALLNWEVPGNWDGVSDITLKLYCYNENGDVIAQDETIVFDVTYRSIDIDGHEAYDNGTAVSTSATYTETANPGNDRQGEVVEYTIDYDSTDQPVTAGDVIGISFDRDFSGDTYSGDIIITRVEIEYMSISLADHT